MHPILGEAGKRSERCQKDEDRKTKTERKFHENLNPSWGDLFEPARKLCCLELL
jgi:hypothetical protein